MQRTDIEIEFEQKVKRIEYAITNAIRSIDNDQTTYYIEIHTALVNVLKRMLKYVELEHIKALNGI